MALLATALATVAACGDGEQRPPASQSPPRPQRPVLRLVALTDLSGYLEPCGCQSRPLGGIDKASAEVRALGRDGVPAVVVAAGNLLFGASDHGDPTAHGTEADLARQQGWQAETLAAALNQLSLAAAAPGPADLAQGLEQLQGLAARGRFSWLGAGLQPDAQAAKAEPVLQDSVLIERGGLRVGVFGLVDPGGSPGFRAPDDLEHTAQHAADHLHARGAQVVVGLLTADARGARRLAGALHGVDFLLLGGLDSKETPPPERVGQTTLLRAAHDGHGLLVVDLFRTGDGPFADASAWTRDAQKAALEARADELGGRVEAWEQDKRVDPALVAEQKARLRNMREQIAALDQTHLPKGNAFAARFVELGPEAVSDVDTRALLVAHDRRVNEQNKIALANLQPAPVPKGMPGYVGSERCGQCHEPALAWWHGHPHGHAYATLEQRNKQYSLACVGCHVTGYDRPGGATVVHNAGLTNVGCESCHGPGSLHAQNPDVEAAKNVTRAVPEATCKGCHNEEHSDRFEYASYEAKLIVPGHGLPPPEDGAAAAPSPAPASRAAPAAPPAKAGAKPAAPAAARAQPE